MSSSLQSMLVTATRIVAVPDEPSKSTAPATISLIVPASQDQINGGLQSGSLPPLKTVVDMIPHVQRDNELAARDVVIASLLSSASLHLSTVWQSNVLKFSLGIPTQWFLDSDPASQPAVIDVTGPVNHVKPSSKSIDGAIPDKDLWARDMVLGQAILDQMFQYVGWLVPPIYPALPPLTVSWSLGEGQPIPSAPNAYFRLDVSNYKLADEWLAARDNFIATNVAQLAQVGSNPFVNASRMLVQAGSDLPVPYVLSSLSAGSSVIFVAEPRLDGRFQVVYDTDSGTLQWTGVNGNVVHTPQLQPYGLGSTTISAPTDTGQLGFIPQIPGQETCQFWVQQASKINRIGSFPTNVSILTGADAAGSDQDGLISILQMTKPGQVLLDGLIPSSNPSEVTLMIEARSFVSWIGTEISGLDSDGQFPAGITSTATLPIDVNDGQWTLEITPQNTGTEPVTTWDLVVAVGTQLVTTSILNQVSGFNVVTSGPTSITFTWTPRVPGSKLAILNVRLWRKPGTEIKEININFQDNGSGQIQTTHSLCLETWPSAVAVFKADSWMGPTAVLDWIDNPSNISSLAIYQVQTKSIQPIPVTPNSIGMDFWPANCLTRAFKGLRDRWASMTGNVPTLWTKDGTQTIWTAENYETWILYMLRSDGTLPDAFVPAGPGDVGRPALIPSGIHFDPTTGLVLADDAVPVPILTTLQPWHLVFEPRVASGLFTPGPAFPTT